MRLTNGTTTRGREYFKQGIDIDDVDERAAEEFGFDSVQEYRRAIAARQFGMQQPQAMPQQKSQPPQAGSVNREQVAAVVEELLEELLAAQT